MIDWTEWPGKSASKEGFSEHPAAYHMLDVAAVSEVLIGPFGFSEELAQALTLLVALHDLGKLSDSFRAMLRDGHAQRYRHWELTEVLLYLNDPILGSALGSEPRRRQALYGASAGHHGRPSQLEIGGLVQVGRSPRDLREAIRQVGSGLSAAEALIAEFLLLWPRASLKELDFDRAQALSWWLPGLCAVADWIGSNTLWFPSDNRPRSLATYLDDKREVAKQAVVVAGLSTPVLRSEPLFDFTLRPMQSAAAQVDLPNGPNLVIIEDETGAGKTEAALLVAQRMISQGKGRGIFFALPTMATADAMFLRSVKSMERMFSGASLTLAHGRAGLSEVFRELVKPYKQTPDSELVREEGPSCSEWLSEAPRRALLANVGVGTIDQALLTVLPVRHQAMRGFGLSSKVLIIDEVHEMGEAYIAEELSALLRLHHRMGGSAILLTATLPLALRAKLLASYDAQAQTQCYPALTVSGGSQITDFAPEDRVKRGVVEVKRLTDVPSAVDVLLRSAAAGAACVWVRNSVDDAILAQKALQDAGIKVRLLHARFSLGDRKRIEAEIAARVGKNGTKRAGFVLIGTQVLESSLDFDFDVMISDIAPIGALIQRAGRLWRHMELRPASQRPVSSPVFYILSPDPSRVEDDKWLRTTLGSGAYVYSLADIWRSARVIFSAGAITAPEGLREMIEAVYGDVAEAIPEVLEVAEQEMLGKSAAARRQAVHNIVDFRQSYRDAGRGDDEARYPTRLGEEPRPLLLARLGAGGLVPWVAAETEAEAEAEAWALSEVSARQSRLRDLSLPDQNLPEIAALTRSWPSWKKGRYVICPVSETGSICAGLRYEAQSGLIYEPTR